MEGWRRLLSLLRRREMDGGLDEEILFHIDAQTQKNLQAGLAPEEARRQALIKFGGVERTREGTRDQFRFRVSSARIASPPGHTCARRSGRPGRMILST
jgi:hypothetical protein